MSRSSKSRSFIFFNVVFIYIIASFAWWSYLLHKNNYENYNELVDRQLNNYMLSGGIASQFYKQAVYSEINDSFRRTELMLYGEGAVFILLISIGFWRIRKTFREEISLTRRQNNFLLSITHELKSPLASLKLAMQTLQKRQLQYEHVKNMADMSMDDVERLEALVENILLASKIESTNFKLDKELLELSAIVKNIYDRIQIKYKKHRVFVQEIGDNIYVHADRLSVSSVVYNLIENAIKYSVEGSLIKVKLTGDEKNAHLSVTDQGIGIEENEKSKIFERFYRIGREETRTTKGTGLGLFIVKQIVTMHDGSIAVKDNLPKGSIFEVTLPVQN